MRRRAGLLNLSLALALTVAIAIAAGCGDKAQEEPSDIVAGQRLFRGNCSMCHGPTGQGIPRLGKNLSANRFVESLSDEELAQFLEVGRPAQHPLNEQGVDMPPKGGNPRLSDQDLFLIALYVRSIQ